MEPRRLEVGRALFSDWPVGAAVGAGAGAGAATGAAVAGRGTGVAAARLVSEASAAGAADPDRAGRRVSRLAVCAGRFGDEGGGAIAATSFPVAAGRMAALRPVVAGAAEAADFFGAAGVRPLAAVEDFFVEVVRFIDKSGGAS